LHPLKETSIPGEGHGLTPLQLVDVGIERVDQIVLGDRKHGAGSEAI
jgi:hypothetical protein